MPVRDELGTSTLDDFTDKELADMIRNSIYAKNTRFGGESAFRCRFLLVLAIPYGPDEDVNDLPSAIEGFQRFLSDDDWPERDFQVYDHNATQQFFSASFEEVEGNRDVAEEE